MDELIADIEAYARALDVPPQKVLRAAVGANWRQWDGWKAGTSSPTMKVADRLRGYMSQNPPHADEAAA